MRLAWQLFAAGALAYGCTRTTELIAPLPVQECSPPGPIIKLGGTDETACSGALAARLGRYALCSCEDLILTGELSVRGRAGMGGMGGLGGLQGAGGMGGQGPVPGERPPPMFLTAVGTDGNARIAGRVEVAGSFIAAGAGEAAFFQRGGVRGNLRTGGALANNSPGPIYVDGDVYAGGGLSGSFQIQGALHVPPMSTVPGQTQAQSILEEDISVPAPCDCAAGPVFDFPETIAGRKLTNANATLPFSSPVLEDATTPQTLDWPCGEYYLNEIQSSAEAALDFRIHGRVAIFVAGDIRLGNNLHVTLDPGAELDLVVGGSFFMTGRVFGSPEQPASTRLWVGSTTVSLPDHVQFGAAVYAPMAVFSAGSGLTFSGTLFVGTLSVAGNARILYDPAAMLAGKSCGVAPPAPVE